MKSSKKFTGRATSVPIGLCYGGAVSLIITLIGAALTAKVISTEVLEWSHTGYAVLIILIAASWCGAMVSFARIKRRRLLICTLSAIIYYVLLLLMTALFFGGRYSGAGETLLVVACGSFLAAIWKSEKKRPGFSKNLKMRNC